MSPCHYTQGSTYSQEGANDTNHNGKEKNQEQPECATLVSRGLGIHYRKWKRAVAGQDCVQV